MAEEIVLCLVLSLEQIVEGHPEGHLEAQLELVLEVDPEEDPASKTLAVKPGLGRKAVAGVEQDSGRRVVAHKDLVVARLGVEVVPYLAKE